MKELTYPCVVGHRILELTAAQRDALEWRLSPVEVKIDTLRQQVQDQAAVVESLRAALHSISLCSQNSASSKDECGRVARAALGAP